METGEGNKKSKQLEVSLPKPDRLGKERNLFDQPILSSLVSAVSEDFIGVDEGVARVCVSITARSLANSAEGQIPQQISREAALRVHGYMLGKDIEISTIQARPITAAILQFLMQVEGLGEYIATQTAGAYRHNGELKNPDVHHVDEPTYGEWIGRKRAAEKRKAETVGIKEIFNSSKVIPRKKKEKEENEESIDLE